MGLLHLAAGSDSDHATIWSSDFFLMPSLLKQVETTHRTSKKAP